MRTRRLLLCAVGVVLGCAEGADGVGSGSGRSGGSGGAPEASSSSSPVATGATSSSGSGKGGAGGLDLCDYTSPNACATGAVMAPIAGDAGAEMQTQYGATSEWITVRIIETKFDPVDQDKNPLSYTVTLKSPPGMQFDLFVQEGVSDGGAVCDGAIIKGAGPAGSVSVASSWNDDIDFGDDKDDHRYLSIEVRYVSGAECGADAEWTLTVAGHT